MKLSFRKPRAVRLSIPEPCSQSWQEMTPVTGGRHCAACSKTVTDFTTMTDRELFDWFRHGQSTCGQFYQDQLERTIAAPRESRHSFWIRLGLGVIALLGFAKEGKAQDKKMKQVILAPSPSAEKSAPVNTPETAYAKIAGAVKDIKGEGLPGVSVEVKDTNGLSIASAATDINGEYSVPITTDSSSNCTVVFRSPGSADKIVTGIKVKRGETIEVNYRYEPLTDMQRKTLTTVGLIVRYRPRFIQPEGVHTVHRMKDGE